MKYCWSYCWKSLVQTDTTFKMLNSETPCCTEHIYISSTWYTGLILGFWTSNEGLTRFILHFSTQLSISKDLWLMQNRLLYRKLPRRSPIVKRNEIFIEHSPSHKWKVSQKVFDTSRWKKQMFDGFVFSERNIAAVLSCFSSKFAQLYFFFLALPISLVKALAREFFL